MSKATRQAFGETIADLGAQHSEIVVLDADLAKSTKSELFQKKFPERFYEMGIAEANMIGTAAGLAFSGKIPFLCSFGCFLTGRYDTIRISAAYSQANIRLVGTHAGVGIGEDGHTQMGLEDIGLMRSLPKMGVFQPMDALDTQKTIEFLVREWKGPAYLRLTRQNLDDLLPQDIPFEATRLMPVRQDSDAEIVCIASGSGVQSAYYAAEKLQEQGIRMSVWNAHCLKPFDEERTVQVTKDAKLVVTVEDHYVDGGVGTCVAEVFARQERHPRLFKIGVQDRFGETGTPEDLYEAFGLSAPKVAAQILETFQR